MKIKLAFAKYSIESEKLLYISLMTPIWL